MPALRIACALPEGCALSVGEYGEGGRFALTLYRPGVVRLQLNSLTSLSPPFTLQRATRASIPTNAPDDWDGEQRDAFKFKSARMLLHRLNLIIRWYRAQMQATAIHELTLAQAGPFLFTEDPGGELWGEFRVSPLTVPAIVVESTSDALRRVKEGFASELEPPVEVLLLLDAREALSEGRFREAVLFGWGVIDGTFNQKFESLVKLHLSEEWTESRRFLMGNDFGLRHKMGIGMRLVAGRSLVKEPDDFWAKLDLSYKSRNRIIHEGATASEDEAELAIWVAQRVVEIMKNI